MTIRYDSAPIQARFDAHGYLRDDPVVARVGILTYREKDGTERNELRLPDEVFRADSLESYVGMPITIGHKAMVNAKNFKQLGVGTVIGAGRQDGENVRAPIIIQDETAISAAKAQRLLQLSVGYNVDYVPRSGWYNSATGDVNYDDQRKDGDGDQEFIGKEWVRFDGLQTNIRVNHVALVRKGRAGSVARLNLDGDEEIDYNGDDNLFIKGGKMKTIRLDSGAEFEVEEQLAAHIDNLANSVLSEKTRADGLEKDKNELAVKVEMLQAEVNDLPAKLEQARNDAAASLKARADLEKSAAQFGVKVEAGTTDVALKKAVIGKISKINLDGKDDSQVDLAYQIAINSDLAKLKQSHAINTGAGRSDSADSGESSAAEARKRMQEKLLKGGK